MWHSYLINMEQETQRYSNCEKQFRQEGIPFTCIEAVNGKLLSAEEIAQVYDHKRNRKYAKHPLTKPEIGCYLSHIKAWKAILDSGDSGGFIFEDDFRIIAPLKPILEALSKTSEVSGCKQIHSGRPSDDIVKLFTLKQNRRVIGQHPLTAATSLVTPYQVPTCLLGYAITARGAQKLIETSLPFFRPVDEDHKFFWEKSLKVGLVHPAPLEIGDQRAVHGTISSSRAQANSAGLQGIANILHKLSYQLDYRTKLLYYRTIDGDYQRTSTAPPQSFPKPIQDKDHWAAQSVQTLKKCDGFGSQKRPQLKVRIINVAGQAERRALQQRQMTALNFDYEIVDGIDSANLNQKTIDDHQGKWERPLRTTEIACLMSHQKIWAEIAQGNAPMLVLEDDALLSSKTPQVISSLLEMVQTGKISANHISLETRGRKKLLGRKCINIPGSENGTKHSSHCVRPLYLDRTGAAAYVLWPEGARRLLERSRAQPGLADAMLASAFDLMAWQIDPALAIQSDQAHRFGLNAPISTHSTISPKNNPRPPAQGLWQRIKYFVVHVNAQARMGLRQIAKAPFAFRKEPPIEIDSFVIHIRK